MTQHSTHDKVDRIGVASSGQRVRLGTVLLLTALVIAGCGSANATAGKDRSGTKSGVSSPADEICEQMTRDNVTNQLTVGRVQGAPVRTKTGSVTTCTYPIAGGSLRMTVDQRSDDAAAQRIFAATKRAATSPARVPFLGTEAFTGHDGTTITIKEDKVLTVDPTALPAGNDRTQIAQSLSFEILDCWSH